MDQIGMTTIATDGVTIAGDGLCVRGSEIVKRDRAKIQVMRDPPAIYAIAGPSGMLDALIAWHRAGANPKEVPPVGPNEGWSLLIITQDGKVFSAADGTPYLASVDLPFAIGSGRDFAVVALDLGHSAEDAIRAACKRDAWSGGEIQVINIAEALGIVKPNGVGVQDNRVFPIADGEFRWLSV